MIDARNRLFVFAFLLLTLNALTNFIGDSVLIRGWPLAALMLFDVSAIVWLAIGAALHLLWDAQQNVAMRRADYGWLGAALLAAFVPIPALSSIMLTGFAGWGWCSSAPRSALRRASAIVLSITAFLLWGRITLAWGAGPLLQLDARFVSLISGMRSAGNVVNFADGSHFMIAPGCSSLHGISLALILWTTVVQYFGIGLSARSWWTLAIAIMAMILINGIRLSMIALHPHDFDYWHSGSGAALFGWVALAVAMAVVYTGLVSARRLA